VLLCWLALLLRFIETRTGRTRAAVREDLTARPALSSRPSGPTTATRAVLGSLVITPPR
jgi:hypothetical protein